MEARDEDVVFSDARKLKRMNALPPNLGMYPGYSALPGRLHACLACCGHSGRGWYRCRAEPLSMGRIVIRHGRKFQWTVGRIPVVGVELDPDQLVSG